MVSHPIQYQAPLLRRIAAERNLDLRVIFEKKNYNKPYFDEGFQRQIKWDIDLTEGYNFLTVAEADLKAEVERADVLWLHGWQTWTIRNVLRIANRSRTPVIMRGENNNIAMPDGPGLQGILKRNYIKSILSKCDYFLSIGSDNTLYYRDRGVSSDRIFSMPYAIDNNYFANLASRSVARQGELRKKLGIKPYEPVILYVGKLTRRKRLDVLIKAFFEAEWASEKPALVFVGEGELKEQLIKNAPRAKFPGFVNQSQLPAYYALADVFVLPSEREPWGLVVNEAMACGTPVVVSNQVGCASDLVDGRSGLVVEVGNYKDLAEALAKTLRDSVSMGFYAQEKIQKWSFDEDVVGLKKAVFAAIGKK
tara:strand:- start:393 stop:1487 length:1095 start_codon:yes stop_codon:yes gene_type:complete